MGDKPFSGNGTIGRLHTRVAPTPPRMLQKKDCEKIWSNVREAERAMGWIQWIATKDEAWRNPWVINARYQECKQWPAQLEEAKYTQARDQLMAYDRGELALSAEDAVRLRGAVNKVQSLYEVSTPYVTAPADYMSEPERELFRRSGNNLGMALMPTSIPGVLGARWLGADETVAAQAGLATAGVLGVGSATIASKGHRPLTPPSRPTTGLYIGPLKAPKQVSIQFERKQLQAKYKHAKDFGVDEPWNKNAAAAYQSSLESHVQNPSTVRIPGTYRGDPVIHYLNPSTGLNVVTDTSNNFISGWRLNPSQVSNVQNRGSL